MRVVGSRRAGYAPVAEIHTDRHIDAEERATMDQTQLRRYLEDHVAGADVGLTIATRLERDHLGTETAAVMSRMSRDIRSERELVVDALRRLEAPRDPVRRAMGIVGSLGRHAASLPFVPGPSLLEDLEALAVGVWGKRLLWGALARVQESTDIDPRGDLDGLAARAEEQERVIVRLRQDALVDLFDLETA